MKWMKPEFDSIFFLGEGEVQEGGGGGQESRKKWLSNKWTLLKYVIHKLLSNKFVFFLLIFWFYAIFCWVSFKLQVHYNKDHYVIVQSLLSSTCDLFSKIFEVFNEMEM